MGRDYFFFKSNVKYVLRRKYKNFLIAMSFFVYWRIDFDLKDLDESSSTCEFILGT